MGFVVTMALSLTTQDPVTEERDDLRRQDRDLFSDIISLASVRGPSYDT